MKTLLNILMLLICVSSTAQTPDSSNKQTYPPVQPPQPVLSKFGTEFPGVSAQWEEHNNNYTAQYTDTKSNAGRRIVYDRNGNVLSTDAQLDNKSYPATISDYYKKNYPNETYEIWSSEDGNGNITYYSKRGNNVILFDKHGKYRSTKPIKPAKATAETKSTGVGK